jgi:hypothetical protein
LLAEFIVSVDKAGELARGNESVSALKARLGELQVEFAKVKAPAAAAGKAVQQALGGGGKSLLGSLGAQGHAQTLRGKLAGAVASVRDAFSGGGAAQGPGLIATLGTVRNGLIALGAGAAIHGVKRLVDGIGDISEGAARLGVTTDEFQRMSAYAKQNATDVETLGTAFRTLATSAVDPTKESAAAFAKLGISVKDGSGQFKTSRELFFETGEALAGVSNETERTQLAQKLLGRSAMALKPMFAQGTEAFRKQREEMLKLKVLSPEVIAAADELSDSWVVLGAQLLATAGPVLQDVLFPALRALTGYLVKGVEWIGKLLKRTDLASVAITALAFAVSAKLLPYLSTLITDGVKASGSLAKFGVSAAKAAFSFLRLALGLLVLQDFITFLRGGDSETGRALDAIFGKGTAEGTLKAVNDLAAALKDLWNWLLGNGMGDSARSLYRDLSDFISLITNDVLELIGIGKGGINGPLKLGGDTHKLLDAGKIIGNFLTGDIGGAARAGISLVGGSSDGPATIPAPGGGGQYGPATATGMNGAVTYGDNHVTINGMRVEDAKVVAGEMEAALDRFERDRLVAQAP